MKLVTDANVMFSAFLRDGLTRRLWLDRRLELYAPVFLLEEFKLHAPELVRRSHLSPEDATDLVLLLARRLKLSKRDELAPFIPAAHSLTRDEKDEPYLACALAVGAELWGHDRHLIQPRIKLWGTKELAKELGYL